MNNPDSGLYLPIRFYDNIGHQDRFKHSLMLTELNYPYVDCVTLAPFQIVYSGNAVSQTIQMDLYCYKSMTEAGQLFNLITSPSCWEEWIDYETGLVHTSYLGNDDFTDIFGNGIYYLKVTIVDSNAVEHAYYSELFMVGNCSAPADLNEYRRYDDNQENLRKVDVNDLRIIAKPL